MTSEQWVERLKGEAAGARLTVQNTASGWITTAEPDDLEPFGSGWVLVRSGGVCLLQPLSALSVRWYVPEGESMSMQEGRDDRCENLQ